MLRSWLTFGFFARLGSWGSLLIIDDMSLGIKPSSLPESSDSSLPSVRAWFVIPLCSSISLSAPVILCALDDLPTLLMVIAMT
jgi:hypothetical protein